MAREQIARSCMGVIQSDDLVERGSRLDIPP